MFDCIITFFLIASAIVANKIVVTYLPTFLFIAIRMGISGLLLYAWHANKSALLKKTIAYKYHLLYLCFCTTLIPPLCKAISLKHISASRATFWGAFDPFITIILLYLLFKKTISKQQFFGCCLGVFAGVYFVLFSSPAAGGIFSTSLFGWADFFQIFAIALGRYGWTLAQKLFQDNVFSPEEFNAIIHLTSSVICLFFHFLSPEAGIRSINFTLSLIIAILYTSIVGNIVAYTSYAYLLKRYVATYVSLATILTPLFVHLISPFLFGERLSPVFFVSIFLMFISMNIFYFKRKV